MLFWRAGCYPKPLLLPQSPQANQSCVWFLPVALFSPVAYVSHTSPLREKLISVGVRQDAGVYLCALVAQELLCAPHLSGYESVELSGASIACVRQHLKETGRTRDCAARHPDCSEGPAWAHVTALCPVSPVRPQQHQP